SELSLAQETLFAAFVPFRRIWMAKWGLPVARVGNTGLDYHPLRDSPMDLSPRTTGELMLFMNDTITPVAVHAERPFLGMGWSESYRDNRGELVVSIRKLQDPPSSRVASTAAAF
ncbi:MAG: hypothetical protein ACREUC_00730, partial [Steroidobacteraceae bacterium]